MKAKGTVYLVGAGPGDLGLLTLRGAELLRRADVVVSDALVNSDLLAMVPTGAEIIVRRRRFSRGARARPMRGDPGEEVADIRPFVRRRFDRRLE